MSSSDDNERFELVRVKSDDWARKLIDLGPRNTLLKFRNTKLASVDLTGADPSTLADLLAGRPVQLNALITDPLAHKEACTRARSLSRRIRAFEEEQGVDVGKVADGLLVTSPPPTKGTSPVPALRAPLLLRGIRITPRTIAETDYTLVADETAEVNEVLLHGLAQHYGLAVDIDQFIRTAEEALLSAADPRQHPAIVHDMLLRLDTAQQIGMRLEPSVVVGMFNYEKLPMVKDLRNATKLLAGHDVIAALAGHAPAASALRVDQDPISASVLENRPPQDEHLVHDADSSQHHAIMTALSGRHILIEGPPGTGKSQTIANIIAGAAAAGKRVLFVAEKRAAIEAVTDRLAQSGLADLVFDMHQQKTDKKLLAKQMQTSLDAATRQQRPETGDLHARLSDRRSTVRSYPDELHEPRSPWGMSAYQVQAELMALRDTPVRHMFRGPVLQALDRTKVQELEEDLRRFVESGGSRVVRNESPWSNASVYDEHDIERVLAELDQLTGATLRDSQLGMQNLVRQTGLAPPRDFAGWQTVLDLLDGVHRSVQAFGANVFGTQLDDWWYATAKRAQRATRPGTLTWSQRRMTVKQVKAASKDGITRKAALNARLAEILQQRDQWHQLGGGNVRPAEIMGLQQTTEVFHTLRTQLAAVAMCAKLPDLEQVPTEQVDHHVHALSSDKGTLMRMPTINRLLAKFQSLGLMGLVTDIAAQDASSEQAWLMFRRAWLASLIDEFRMRVPALREFVAERQNRLVDDYQRTDVEHRLTAAERVRWAVAKNLRQVRNDYPQETDLLKKQANKQSRHLPTRRLVENAPHVMLALRPCWAMSPLVVSRLLPPQRLFDLVVFDEASQIEPHDAITSIARGHTVIVAGDDKQLPPTNFFSRMLAGLDEDDDEDTEDLKDYESVLTAMRSLLPQQTMLRWHYRSQDERLIAFSNRELYDNRLVTFPGALRDTPIALEIVDGVASPGQDGSSPVEIARVVERVLDHAEHRPDESLGVITMGQKHMDRVEKAIRDAVRERADLQEFFSEDKGPGRRFFVKNLERVQGDERDVIILTVGVAKRASGSVARTGFGPLNSESGVRRLNVAVTRAKRRMIVISSFGPQALAPVAERTGTELLRRYLEFAQHHGEIDKVGWQGDQPLNGFEEDIRRALTERGVAVFPQWGFSGYRIDFALAHRDHPGRMVLAVECDGDTYHRAYHTRDRDRLRQSHLERLGWRFHRVWASAWFADRDGEADRLLKAWAEAMDTADDRPPSAETVPPGRPAASRPIQRAIRPPVPRGLKITDYTDEQLISICRWLLTDRLQLDREERIDQALRELGFQRRGARIVERLAKAIDIAQHLADISEEQA